MREGASMTGEEDTGNINRREILLIVMSLYLIGTLIYRVLLPAHSYPLRNMQLMTMALDLGVIVGLCALKSKLTTMRTLFWIVLGLRHRPVCDPPHQRRGLVDRAPDLSNGGRVRGAGAFAPGPC
jgi:hypothetical protein